MRPAIKTAMSVYKLGCFGLELTLQHARCIETFGSLDGIIRSFPSTEGPIEDGKRVSQGDSAREESTDEILRGGVFGRLWRRSVEKKDQRDAGHSNKQ